MERPRTSLMVTLPPPFTATQYDGYFWNTETHELYSMKMGGVLRKLPLKTPNRFNNAHEPFYVVYNKGRRTWLLQSILKKLKLEHSEIPVLEGSLYDYYSGSNGSYGTPHKCGER